jgi:hypothetical protein
MRIEGMPMDNHSEMGRQKFLEAIGEAAKELESLEKRAAHLRTFIAEGKILLGEDDSTDRLPSVPPMEPVRVHHLETQNGHDTTQALTIADWARRYLEEVGKPMRVTEIAKALVERQWVTSQHAIGAIRTAMGRRADFERIAFGVYALKEWPSAMKRWTSRPARPLTPRKHRSVESDGLPQLIYAVLAEEGKPLTFKEIIEFFEAQGHRVNRASAIRAIYRCIKGGRLFYLVAPGLFGLLEWHNSREANYNTPARMQETHPSEGSMMKESQQGELKEAENTVDYQPV